jgi:dipeptidyl aminopeptidase/acylaminoacyl peptidase
MTGEYAGESDRVKCVVDCFGPTDLEAMMDEDYAGLKNDPETIFARLCGFPVSAETRERMRLISPMRYVEAGRDLPPFLILHGTGDPVVNYSQSERLFRKLIDCGYDATMYNVPDAPHEGSFWSAALVDAVHEYLTRRV